MGWLPGCNCHCGCCVPATETGIDWDRIPQRFSINTGAWSWGMPSGITQVSDGLTGDPFDKYHMTLFARSLNNVGQGNVAWIVPYNPEINGSKYSEAFGPVPPGVSSYRSSAEGVWQWVSADDESLWQGWWDAYEFGIPYQFAGLYSSLTERIDASDNASGATPWRQPDMDAIYAQAYAQIDSSIIDNLGNPANDGWGSGTVSTTIGTEHRIYTQTLPTGQCYWVCKIKIKPRFSILTDGGVPPHLGLNSLFGHVDPAVSRRSGTIVSNPPYQINAGHGYWSFYDEQATLVNRGGFGDLGTLTSKPPGGWRSWIEIGYVSDNPINCNDDIQDMNEIPMHLNEQVAMGGLPGYPVPVPTWSEYLSIMNTAFGLAAPPSTMTIQRLEDIT